MDYSIGQRVRIADHAFSDSDGVSREVEYRGQLAVVVENLEERFGADWAGCIIVRTDDGQDHYVTIDELLAAKED